MGSGKTTIGRMLARRLGRRFLDSDHEIEQRAGMKVPQIFEKEGEAGFRALEAETIADITQEAGIVLATGGGAVLNPENRRNLGGTGWVVYLDVPPTVLFDRTRHDSNRPLLQVEDPLARLLALRAQRAPLYREIADCVIDGSRGNSQVAIQKILKEWEKWSAHLT